MGGVPRGQEKNPEGAEEKVRKGEEAPGAKGKIPRDRGKSSEWAETGMTFRWGGEKGPEGEWNSWEMRKGPRGRGKRSGMEGKLR
jgi:hypothetical protein